MNDFAKMTPSGLAMNTSRMVGAEVKSLDGSDVGHVDDLVVDLVSGQISSVLIAIGGFFSIGGDRYAVPWDSVRYVEAIDGFVLNLAKEDIEKALRSGEDDEATLRLPGASPLSPAM